MAQLCLSCCKTFTITSRVALFLESHSFITGSQPKYGHTIYPATVVTVYAQTRNGRNRDGNAAFQFLNLANQQRQLTMPLECSAQQGPSARQSRQGGSGSGAAWPEPGTEATDRTGGTATGFTTSHPSQTPAPAVARQKSREAPYVQRCPTALPSPHHFRQDPDLASPPLTTRSIGLASCCAVRFTLHTRTRIYMDGWIV